MGVNYNSAFFLKRCKENGVVFDSLCTLGHQELYIKDGLRSRLEKEVPTYSGAICRQQYSDEMFRRLGAKDIGILDASGYENANIIHDMNLPVPEKYKEKFSCVFDGGATEHIFNFPIAIQNIMEMLKWGGYYIGCVPSDHLNGHGLYQFGAGLYTQLFSKVNGFELLEIGYSINENNKEFWRIKDIDKGRIEVSSNKALMIYVVAKKIASSKADIVVQEKYYEELWNAGDNSNRTRGMQGRTIMKYIPNFLMLLLRKSKRIICGNQLHAVCEKIIM